MNDLPTAMNSLPTGISAVSDDMLSVPVGQRPRAARWIQVSVIIAIWATAYLVFTAQQLMLAPEGRRWWYLVPRGISCAAGAIISLGILAVQLRLRPYSLVARSLAAVALALGGTALLAALNYPIFLPFMPKAEQGASPLWLAYLFDFLTRFWIFVSISGIILAFSYLADIRAREDRISALQALAQSAQLRALRNQLNPHFLFNSLNSIAGLISGNENRRAESMTENLADFLRLSLILDPQQLISLREELRLQELYLSIEQVRFPDRLKVSVDVPEDLQEALVPSLIAQPLIENSVKHAVAQSTETVDLRISAAGLGDCLELVIEDSGGNAPQTPAKGGHLGLSNVSERLAVHYGDRARAETGPTSRGGFRNVIRLPLRFA
jgi:two-component system LytT family sensor kinase